MSCFNNQDVETAVSQALVDAGVKVYSGYIFAQWDMVCADFDERHGEVTSVSFTSTSFTSESTPLTLSCVVSACCFQPCNDQVAKVLKILYMYRCLFHHTGGKHKVMNESTANKADIVDKIYSIEKS